MYFSEGLVEIHEVKKQLVHLLFNFGLCVHQKAEFTDMTFRFEAFSVYSFSLLGYARIKSGCLPCFWSTHDAFPKSGAPLSIYNEQVLASHC